MLPNGVLHLSSCLIPSGMSCCVPCALDIPSLGNVSSGGNRCEGRHAQWSTFQSFRLCSAVPCCAVLCSAVQCCAVLCCAVLCCAVLCCAVLCCAVLCCAVLCCAVLCCAVLCIRGSSLAGTIRWFVMSTARPVLHNHVSPGLLWGGLGVAFGTAVLCASLLASTSPTAHGSLYVSQPTVTQLAPHVHPAPYARSGAMDAAASAHAGPVDPLGLAHGRQTSTTNRDASITARGPANASNAGIIATLGLALVAVTVAVVSAVQRYANAHRPTPSAVRTRTGRGKFSGGENCTGKIAVKKSGEISPLSKFSRRVTNNSTANSDAGGSVAHQDIRATIQSPPGHIRSHPEPIRKSQKLSRAYQEITTFLEVA